MIIVKLMGGLGNQMFQYAAARSLALEKNTWVYLDATFLNEDAKGRWTQREYELGAFNIKYKFERSGRVSFLASLNSSNWRKKLSDSGLWFLPYRNFYQADHKFHPELFSYPKNTYLHGYFQSEQYFAKHADQIRRDFEFLEPAKGRNEGVLERIRNSRSVSIHVRRGDYVTLAAANQFHGLMGVEYYDAGVNEIISKTLSTHTYFVFSDDPQWARKNLRFPGETEFIDWNTGSSGFEDLRLMSNCEHHIIANSSFSWWGAWLNPSPSKIVIAPKFWFNDNSDQSDIVPRTWIKL
jgi:hypothetical protein